MAQTDFLDLFLKNGMMLQCLISKTKEGRFISIYEDGFLNYTIEVGKSLQQRFLKLGDTTEHLKLWEVANVNEIYENFDQYFNMLEQVESFKKEKIVYLVDEGMDKISINDNDAFIELATKKGTIYSIDGFVRAFNNSEVNTETDFIKII